MKTLFPIAAALFCPMLACAQTVYPEKVSLTTELRGRLSQQRVKLPPGTADPILALSKLKGVPPFTYDLALFALGIGEQVSTDTNALEFLMSNGVFAKSIVHWKVPVEELPLPDLLDNLTQQARVGWTAREENGEFIVRFVRLKSTPLPESLLPDWANLDTVPDDPLLYPERITPTEALRKRLEGIRINANLIDRNGVGALMALLDARVDHQFDPALKLPKVAGWNLLTADIQRLQARDPEWLYPGLRLQKVTIKANGVALPTALDMLTQSLGVGWTAEQNGERTRVHIVRLRSTPSPVKALKNSLESIRIAANQLGGDSLVQVPPHTSVKEMVSLAIADASIRGAIETLLRTTGRHFMISPESSTLKRSFRFESVSLSSALNLVCDSYNVIWSLERDSKGSAFLSIRKRGETPPKK